MAQAANQELVDRFEEFYRRYYSDDVAELARKYPRESKSLHVDWRDLYQMDPDLADDFINHPDDLKEAAEEALRLYDLPVDVSLGQAHVRVYGLEESTEIRAIRAEHLNSLVSVQGMVRKATDVRPKIQRAVFVCQRCGAETEVPQGDAGFQEPYQCESCERQGPFKLDPERSEFVDSQKLRIQESPEGLAGGETPQSIDVHIADDITGEVTPGDHITISGVLRLDQSEGSDESPVFDLYMEGLSVVIEDEEFEEMNITEKDKQQIVEISDRENLYEQMVDSMAPSIYGHREAKLAMILQLFSGVTKHLPDESRIRGDLHMLLIGDPGTGKSALISYVQNIAPRSVYTSGKGSSAAGLCVTGDTMIHTEDGVREIRDVVSSKLPEPVVDETAVEKQIGVQTFDRESGEMREADSSHAWRMPEKPCCRIETEYGKELEASVNTPVLTCGESGIEWTEISDVEVGDHVAVPKYDDLDRSEQSVRGFLELTTEKVRLADDAIEFLRESLTEEFGTLRDAAAKLDLSEDFIYLHLKNRHVPLETLDRMLDAVDADRSDVAFERLLIRHGDSITVPEAFDEELMYLLGLVFGDGDISLDRRDGNRGMVRLSNGDEALLERAADIFHEKFDKRPEIERQEDRVPCIRVNSATIARLFANAGMESPKTDLALAPELTTAEHADAFLRGLMDADGSVSEREDGGSSVFMSTISERLARQVQFLLESYGIRAGTRERDRRGTYELEDGRTIVSKNVQHFVELYGADIDRYADEIGFESAEKRAALERISKEDRRQRERLPVGAALAVPDGGVTGAYHNNVNGGDHPSRSRARSMLEDIDLGSNTGTVREVADANLRWGKVVAATDTGEKEVFDLTVPRTHNFVGNGVVTHNTAAAVRDDFGDGQQWTLEAGALVLADQGVAAVDELDKMRCVTGDTLVHFDDHVSRIRDFAVEAAESGEAEALPNGRTVRDVDADVWTMTESGRLEKRPVTAVHEYDAPDELLRVTLESGEQVTATRDHPFFAFENGERVEKPAEDLHDNDWVYVPRSLSDIATDGGSTTDCSPADGPTGAGVEPKFAAVLGYLAGDGNLYYDRSEGSYGVRFTNAEEQLLADFEDAARSAFGVQSTRPPSERRDDGVETVRVHGRAHADRVLDAGMNRETYDGKTLPDAVTASSRAAKAAFVRGLADSEGSVGERQVRIHSASYELLLGVKHLLLEFGVSSQIHHREHDEHRDIYKLTVTDSHSLAAFDQWVGFTLDRKQTALEAAVDSVSGDRTILDVIPDAGNQLNAVRTALRLHQSECGVDDTTYCNFENGDANVSIRLARDILDAFESRKQTADRDLEGLQDADWELLESVRNRYHVSQSELATETSFSQQQVSRLWGENDVLREAARSRLEGIVGSVADVDLTHLRELVYGDVKWRRVENVETVACDANDGRIPVLRGELADQLGVSESSVVDATDQLLAREPTVGSWSDLREELARHGIAHEALASDLDTNQSTVTRWLNEDVETDRFVEVADAGLDRIHEVRREVARLRSEIERREQPRVYDLTVAGTHNFVANGMVIHNSEDRSAMHEALEQQKISISKAGINATLKARCSLLGAANPKYGRFDQYEPIGEQIDLEPALISRFDLIFTVTDEPDAEEDAKLAEHILQTNYAGELNTQREQLANPNHTADEVTAETGTVAPAIDASLLRKYIAYSRRNCYPTMTDEAKQAIEEFYVDLRAEGQGEDAPVPVTARQLEALVRLAEASARVRLSDTVEVDDAERVISIVRSCLQDIGVDPETGEYDADVVETGRSKTQRDRVKNVKAIIKEIEDEFDEGAPVEEVLDRAEEVGMDAEKARHEIDKLKEKGELYQPNKDHLRSI